MCDFKRFTLNWEEVKHEGDEKRFFKTNLFPDQRFSSLTELIGSIQTGNFIIKDQEDSYIEAHIYQGDEIVEKPKINIELTPQHKLRATYRNSNPIFSGLEQVVFEESDPDVIVEKATEFLQSKISTKDYDHIKYEKHIRLCIGKPSEPERHGYECDSDSD